MTAGGQQGRRCILLLSSDNQPLEPPAYISHQQPVHPGTQGSPSLPASHTPSSLDPLKLYIVLTVGEFYLFLSCVAVFTQGKLQSPKKVYTLTMEEDNYEIDVLCLTETFESEKEPVQFRQWSELSKPRKDGYGGVSILYKDDESGIVMERKKELERDDVEAISTDQNSFLLITTYIPPEKKEQLEGLPSILDHCKGYKHILNKKS